MRTHLTNKERLRELFETANGRCAYCGNPVTLHANRDTLRMQATCDHVTPKTRGGGEEQENLVLACWMCNKVKDTMTGEEFRYLISNLEVHPDYIDYVKKRIVRQARHSLRPIKPAATVSSG